MSNFSYFIKGLSEFGADKVESYINHINSDIVSVIKKVDFKKSNIMSTVANSISVKMCAETFDDEPTDLMSDDEKTDLFDDDEQTDLFSNNAQMDLFAESQRNATVVDDESTCLLDDEATALFSDDDDKTDLFDEIQATPYKFPTLIRTLTEECAAKGEQI